MIKKVNNYVTINGKFFGLGRNSLTRMDDGRIRGAISIMTDAETKNTVDVEFIPQKETYSTGKPNPNYAILDRILNGEVASVETDGEAKASKLRITAQIETNPYYTSENDQLVLKEFPQVRGNFIHIDDKAKDSHGFSVDALVNSVEDRLDRNGEETGEIELGVSIFNDYRQFWMPVKMIVREPMAIDYIRMNYVPNESYVTVSGEIINQVVETEAESTEMGFGEQTVSSSFTLREMVIVGGTVPRDLPMTDEEMDKVRGNRETYLAERKAYAEENSKGSTSAKGFPSSTNKVADSVKTDEADEEYDF